MGKELMNEHNSFTPRSNCVIMVCMVAVPSLEIAYNSSVSYISYLSISKYQFPFLCFHTQQGGKD